MLRRKMVKYVCSMVFIIALAAPYPACGQGPLDFTVDTKVLKHLNQTYGFLLGQKFTLTRIQREIPELSDQAARAQSKFNVLFASAGKNLEKTLAELFGDSWPELKGKIQRQIRDLLSKSNLTQKGAINFIELVNKRGNGQIETPFLQTLLMCDPQFQQNPVREVGTGFKQTFRTQEHPKAKGLDFQIEYPRSWSAREGRRPNVIQFFKSSYGKGFVSASIMTKDMLLEIGDELTSQELSHLNTLSGAKEIASQAFSDSNLKKMAHSMGMSNVRDIGTKKIVLDRWPGAMLDFVGEQQRLNFTVTMYNKIYLAIYKKYMLFLQCMVGKRPSDDEAAFKKRIAKYSSLFHWMANSLVIHSQYIGGIEEGGLDNLDECFQEAREDYESARYDEAIDTCTRCLKLAKHQEHEQGQGVILGLIGAVQTALGQYQKALSCHQKALAIARKTMDVEGEGTDLMNIGVVYRCLGQYEKALKYFKQSLAIQRKIGDSEGEGNSYNNMGLLYNDLGRYEKALNYFEQALVIHKQIEQVKGEGHVLANIGTVYINGGQYDKALEYYMRAAAIHTKIADANGEAMDFNNIGAVYLRLDQYDKALQYFIRSKEKNSEIGNLKGQGDNLSNIGQVCLCLGQYEKALKYFKQSLAVHRKIGDVKGEGMNLMNVGQVHTYLGQHEKALSYLQKALMIARKIGDVRGEGDNLGGIGAVYWILGQNEKALGYLTQSLAVHRKIGYVWGEGTSLLNIGLVYSDLGQYEKALSYYQKSLTITRKIGDVKEEGRGLSNMGCAMLCEGNYTKAQTHLELAIAVWESIRRHVKTGRERSGFQATLPDAYAKLAVACLAQGKPEGAFESIERGRAKSFLDLLATRATGTKRSNKRTEEIAKMERQLAALREKTVELASAPVGAKTRSGRNALNEKISGLDKQRLDLIYQIRRSDPELGSLVVVDPPSLKEIRSILPKGTVLVEYFHSGKHTVSDKEYDQLWIFVVHKKGLHFKAVDVSKSDLEKTLEKFAKLVANASSDPKAVEAAGAKLHKWLIEPIEPISQLTNTDTLIIVPWGPMFKIPFAALRPKGGKPLCERKNIVMAPSAGVYRYLVKKRALGRKNILAIGNPKTAMTPLPGAEKEAKEIARLFGKSTVRTRSRATEGLIKKDYAALGRPDVVHLACHGIFNERTPQLSHLALTPDQNNDGKLEMHELFDLDWRGVSLVTLSACSSGKGKLGAGDDLVGLTRGFMFAGAPSILCSLWDVDDEDTRALMVSFYKNYLSGMSKPEALRKAQVAMQKNKKWSHPYFWSAFVLFGDWE
ncbi:MAG: tetratricopeptide repeat protein [Desulfobacteraceae bacterium]|nr:tetratricopeptide repeat protein [Desulfobacteraceae bacterium]